MINNHIFKILLLGNSGVGKSSLLLRYCEDVFDLLYTSTIGIDFKIKNIELPINNKLRTNIKLQIWDTAGQERFKSIVTKFYRDVHAVIIMFDLTNLESFNDINIWIEEKDKYCNKSIITFLIGTKSDLKNQIIITHQMINNLCSQLNNNNNNQYIYIETSSKNNININNIFETLCFQLIDKYKLELINQSIISNQINPNTLNKQRNIYLLNEENNYKCCIIS